MATVINTVVVIFIRNLDAKVHLIFNRTDEIKLDYVTRNDGLIVTNTIVSLVTKRSYPLFLKVKFVYYKFNMYTYCLPLGRASLAVTAHLEKLEHKNN